MKGKLEANWKSEKRNFTPIVAAPVHLVHPVHLAGNGRRDEQREKQPRRVMAFGFNRMDYRVLHAAEFKENLFERELFWQNVAQQFSEPAIAKNYFAKTEAALRSHDHLPSAARLKRKIS